MVEEVAAWTGSTSALYIALLILTAVQLWYTKDMVGSNWPLQRTLLLTVAVGCVLRFVEFLVQATSWQHSTSTHKVPMWVVWGVLDTPAFICFFAAFALLLLFLLEIGHFSEGSLKAALLTMGHSETTPTMQSLAKPGLLVTFVRLLFRRVRTIRIIIGSYVGAVSLALITTSIIEWRKGRSPDHGASVTLHWIKSISLIVATVFMFLAFVRYLGTIRKLLYNPKVRQHALVRLGVSLAALILAIPTRVFVLLLEDHYDGKDVLIKPLEHNGGYNGRFFFFLILEVFPAAVCVAAMGVIVRRTTFVAPVPMAHVPNISMQPQQSHTPIRDVSDSASNADDSLWAS